MSARPWLLLFGSTNCEQCAAVKARWQEEREFTEDGPVLVFVNVDDENNYRYLKWLEKAMKVERPSMSLPVMLAGNRLLMNSSEFEDAWAELDDLLKLTPRGSAVQAIQEAADHAEGLVVEWNYVPMSAPSKTSAPSEAAIPEVPLATEVAV